jgi:hypothetical protein
MVFGTMGLMARSMLWPPTAQPTRPLHEAILEELGLHDHGQR